LWGLTWQEVKVKKNFVVSISTICLVSLFLSGCGTGGAPGSQDGSGNAAVQTVTGKTDLCKWIINASDSKNGTYTIPVSGTGSHTTDSEGRKGFDADGDGEADTWYDEDGNIQTDAIQGGYITDSEGHEGLDSDGDGKLDMWVDEDGNTHFDVNKDGKLEVIKGEYSDGAGDGE
jgi:hypothetical protein